MKRFCAIVWLVVVPAVAQVENVRHDQPGRDGADAAFQNVASILLVQPVLPALSVTAKSQIIPAARRHVFWNRAALIRFSILAGLVAGDSITTQQVLNFGGKESNSLPRPFVRHGAAGQLAASSVGYAFAVGVSYWFHRDRHHRMEHIFENLMIGVESASITNNVIQHAPGNTSTQ